MALLARRSPLLSAPLPSRSAFPGPAPSRPAAEPVAEPSRVLAFARDLARAQDLPELNAHFRRRMHGYGFNAHAAGYAPSQEADMTFMLLDWPRAWLELYAAQGFVTDDVAVEAAMRSPAPFTWTEMQRQRPGASARIFAAARSFGWTDGLVVPVHGPGAERGVVSLAAPRLALTAQGRGEVIACCLLAFERARELGPGAARARQVLTRREREALALVAQGRDDAEISATLGVAKTTAHYHVEAAKRRLGARTRAHAVALALTQGLLSILVAVPPGWAALPARCVG